MRIKKYSTTRKEVSIRIFWCLLITLVGCSRDFENLHNDIQELEIKSDQNSHIVSFEPSLDLKGDFFWDFGDSTTSTLKSKTHVYEKMGTYDISLNVVSENQLLTASKTIAIIGLEDLEGNIYSTVRLANQLWTTENLLTTTCSDGTPLDPNHYQIQEDGSILYNYLALEQCNICPDGWRVPTEEDIDNLRFVDKVVAEVETLLKVNENGFNGDYILVQGHRLYYGDFKYAIENNFSWKTVQGDVDDYSAVRCVKVF